MDIAKHGIGVPASNEENDVAGNAPIKFGHHVGGTNIIETSLERKPMVGPRKRTTRRRALVMPEGVTRCQATLSQK